MAGVIGSGRIDGGVGVVVNFFGKSVVTYRFSLATVVCVIRQHVCHLPGPSIGFGVPCGGGMLGMRVKLMDLCL